MPTSRRIRFVGFYNGPYIEPLGNIFCWIFIMDIILPLGQTTEQAC